MPGQNGVPKPNPLKLKKMSLEYHIGAGRARRWLESQPGLGAVFELDAVIP